MLLQLENISFQYPNNKRLVIDQFSMGIEKGDIVGLLGNSGSGKSTLLRLIAGLEDVKDGTIRLENNVISSKAIAIPPEKRQIGMVFQDYGLFPHLTVAQNIAFGLFRLQKETKLTRVEEMLQLIQMTEFKNRFPYQLSGGQQQRVALARALAPRPKLLLMDEPFSNLDATLKADIRKEVRDILQQEKMTCILVSHDDQDIEDICNTKIHVQPQKESVVLV